MSYCPSCRSEYRAGIERCAPCEANLVETLAEPDADRGQRLREAVASGADSAVPIGRAAYADACQMVETLQHKGVDAMVFGDPASCGASGTCSHFLVMVLKDDAEAATMGLKAELRQLLEGEVAKGLDLDAEVDLDAEGAHICPACAESFEGAPEECPHCGLFLGAA